MARPPKLGTDESQSALQGLSGWKVRDGKLHKTFRFKDFVVAWGFMSRVALVAQAMDHHPDWSNSYNTVQVDLATHDAGGITHLDFTLAHKIEDNV